MSTRAALRSADPARGLPDIPLEERDEQLLQRILAGPLPAASVPTRRQPRRDRRPAFVTGVVAVVVVAATIAVIQSTRTDSSPPAASASPSSSSDRALAAAVDERLDQVAGEEAGLDEPSMIWTQAQRGAQGDMIDLTDKTLYTAAACEGGGAIAIRITGRPDTALDCTRFTALGPINLSELLQKEKNGVGFDVVTTSGHPRYLVKQVAYPIASVGDA